MLDIILVYTLIPLFFILLFVAIRWLSKEPEALRTDYAPDHKNNTQSAS